MRINLNQTLSQFSILYKALIKAKRIILEIIKIKQTFCFTKTNTYETSACSTIFPTLRI